MNILFHSLRFFGFESLEPRQLLSANVSITDLGVQVPAWSSDRVTANGITYFLGETPGTFDEELWRTDGTKTGTYRVKDITPGTQGSTLLYLVNANGTLYFDISGGGGNTLWRSDGTDAGTNAVKFFQNGEVDLLGSLNNDVYFSVFTPGDSYGRELWKSDGSAGGTSMLIDLSPGSTSSDFLTSYAWKGKLYFGAINEVKNDGIELYVTDGTKGGTYELKDIYPGANNGYPVDYTPFNNKLYFSANDASHGEELWETDGTASGTKLVKDFLAGSKGSFVEPGIVFNNALYVFTHPTNGVSQMWKIDTSDNATMVKQFANNGSSAYASGAGYGVTALNSKQMFFTAADDTHSDEPWISDGTSAGTHMIEEIMPGGGVSGVGIKGQADTAINGVELFSGVDPTHGDEIWQTDGTVGGTSFVADLVSGSTGSNPFFIATAGQHPLFEADLGNTQGQSYELFSATVSAPPPPVGSVSGYVVGGPVENETIYLDANNNGVLDNNELSTTALPTLVSGRDIYSFSNVPAGNYIIRQMLTGGYTQTSPSSGYGIHITVANGSSITNQNFTDKSQSAPVGGSVSGKVTGDSPGETIFLDANNNSTLDGAELSTTIAVDGTYSLTNVPPAAYIIRQILPSGYTQTSPSGGYGIHITVTNNSSLTNENFTDKSQAAPAGTNISGTVFADSNGNGKKDSGDSGLSDWELFIDTNNNGSVDQGELTTTTDADGDYLFSELANGTYIIRAARTTGYNQTTPTNNYGQHITINSGKSVSGVLFGEKKIQ